MDIYIKQLKESGVLGKELGNLINLYMERQTLAKKEEKDRAAMIEKERIIAEKEEKDRAAMIEKERIIAEKEEKDRAAIIVENEKQRQHEILMMQMQQGNNNNQRERIINIDIIKIAPFNEEKDKIDIYLEKFERIAKESNWDENLWTRKLAPSLTARANDVYVNLNEEDSKDYEKLKEALLKKYNLTENGYKKKFKESKPVNDEDTVQYIERIGTYLDKWIHLSRVEKTFEGVKELFIVDQFLQTCPDKLSIFLQEKNVKNIKEIVRDAEHHLNAHGYHLSNKSYGSMEKKRFFKKEEKDHYSQYERKGTYRSYNDSINNNVRCYICNDTKHIVKDCPQKYNNYKSSNNNWRNSNEGTYERKNNYGNNQNHGNKVRGNVAITTDANQPMIVQEKSHIACYVKNDKKSLCVGDDIKETHCQEKSRMPVRDGYVNQHQVKVLRDTGCNGIITRQKYVHDDQYTKEYGKLILADGSEIVASYAIVEIITPFLKGKVKALCLEKPAYDLLVGNVPNVKGNINMENEYMDEEKEKETLNDGKHEEITHTKENQECKDTPEEKQNNEERKEECAVVLKVGEVKGIDINKDQLKEMQEKDESLIKYSNTINKDKQNGREGNYIIKKSIVYIKGDREKLIQDKLLVPKNLRMNLLTIAHDMPMSGHLGTKKTLERINRVFHWPNINDNVRRFCESCEICQKTFPKGMIKKVPLGKMPIIDVPFKRLAIDLIGKINPASEEGHTYILTLVDYATRYPEAVALKKMDVITVAEELYNIYTRIGIPEEVLSDLGR